MPLAEDRIRALERRPELPEGNPTQIGFPVAYAGTDEDGDDIFAMTSFPDTEVQQGHGDPNTNVNAPKGTLYVDLDAPGLWQNTDGVDTWIQVGGGNFSLGTYSTDVVNGGGTIINCDGTLQSTSFSTGSPPSWLDSSGNILTEGIYFFGAAINKHTAPTTPGLYFACATSGNTTHIFAIDSLGAFSGTIQVFPFGETIALTATDLPFAVTMNAVGQNDATAQVTVTPYVFRLLTT